MRRGLSAAALVAALVAVVPAFAQRGVSPSITSGTYLGYPAASIQTPNNLRLGDSAPHVRSFNAFGGGAFAGHPPAVPPGQKGFIPQREHRGHNGMHNYGGYPYYPAYYYSPYGYDYGYYGGVVMEDNSSLPGAGTFNTQQNAPSVYRPSVGNDSVIDEDARFYDRRREQIGVRESAPGPEQPVAASANVTEEESVRTILVFKDGHQLEIANYAIMGTTVYVFAGDRRKIPLSELDVDATIKANEQRGTDFHVPAPANPS